MVLGALGQITANIILSNVVEVSDTLAVSGICDHDHDVGSYSGPCSIQVPQRFLHLL